MSATGGIVFSGFVLLLIAAIILLVRRDSKRQAEAYHSAMSRFAHDWIVCDVSNVYVHKYFMHQMKEEFKRVKQWTPDFGDEFPSVFVMVFDLDDFKQVNDRFGHLSGNEVLSFFGAVLHAELRATDMAGRFGGDEFIAFGHCSRDSAGAIARRIAQTFRARVFRWHGKKIRLNVSVGLAFFEPRDKSECEVINRADQALYAVKRQGKNGLGFAENSGIAIERFSKPKIKA